jgi:excisionase family DNA binding protein
MRAGMALLRVLLSLEYMETLGPLPQTESAEREKERLSYSIHEAAALLGVDYFSVYRLIQRGKLRACRALRGKLLVPRSELLRLLKTS